MARKRPLQRWISAQSLIKRGIAPFELLDFLKQEGPGYHAATGEMVTKNDDWEETVHAWFFGVDAQVRYSSGNPVMDMAGHHFSGASGRHTYVVPEKIPRQYMLLFKPSDIFPFISRILKEEGNTYDQIFKILFPEEYDGSSADAIKKRIARLLED